MNTYSKYLTDASPSNNVLKEVGKLREMDHKLLPSRRSHRTSTTHHVPPYGMFKQSREKDIIDEELKAASLGGIRKVATPGGELNKKKTQMIMMTIFIITYRNSLIDKTIFRKFTFLPSTS